MTESENAPVGTIVVGVFALLFWLFTVAILSDLGRSDAAGNAIGQAYAAISLIVLWVLLAILALIVVINSTMPLAARVALPLLGLLACHASFNALSLLSHADDAPYRWPLIVPALAPPLIVLFCIGSMLRSVGTKIPARIFAIATLGPLLVVSLSIWPMISISNAVAARAEQVRAKYEADYARLAKDAPLWDWVPFFDTRSEVMQAEVLDGVAHLARRQSDAETMLDRGDFPLGYLGRMELAPTPALCAQARALLGKSVVPLMLKPGEHKAYKVAYGPVADALAAMNWLSRNGCDIRAEATAWEAMASAYTDFNYDVYELRDLKLKPAQ
jgi:hypothetical protein